MSFAFIKDGSIDRYPVGLTEIRRKFPSVSFPENPQQQDLAGFDVIVVTGTPQPSIDTRTHRLEEGLPQKSGGQWRQAWNVVALSNEEKQAIESGKASSVRSERNSRLASCDWTQLPDALVDASAWQLYRQALRDVPDQEGFPWGVEWPAQPA